MILKDCRVSICLWFYRVFHELKNVEKLREHAKGVMGKVREHADGVMDKNGHCAGSIST